MKWFDRQCTVAGGRDWLLASVGAVALASATTVRAGLPVAGVGGEYGPVGALVGDQIVPAVSMDAAGGILAWQDNRAVSTAGIFARYLTASQIGVLSTFQVNSTATGLHESPRVARLPGGGSAFVWRGGPIGQQNIYARFLKPGLGNPVFYSPDIQVNLDGAPVVFPPTLAVAPDGTVVVTWVAPAVDGDGDGVIAQRFDSTGTRLGGEFVVNQTVVSNQRNPTVATLSDGRFIFTWVSENQRFERSVDLMGRFFGKDGAAASDEFRLNYGTNMCSYSSVAPMANGGFAAVWSERDLGQVALGWEVQTRVFNAAGVSSQLPTTVNTTSNGDQVGAEIAGVNGAMMAVWTAYMQDGPRPEVFGRFLDPNGVPQDTEFNLSQLGILAEQDVTLASDGQKGLLAVWTTANLIPSGWDLAARRFESSAVDPGVTASIRWAGPNLVLSWPTTTGGSYQVQASVDLLSWSNPQSPRIAASSTDSISVSPQGSAAFYRVIRTQ